ncbi:uncharacterized protein LOC102068301 [Zonotrichia albicollis]|uniref:uncharacterized protein LOC102068301 n=1 Tax=Zonotrichia albicollis TaxID=44394 RepID=UPI003D80D7F3
MEVTTVFPSPASPTEVNDLCETDVTSVAIHSVTLLVCLCGLAGNWAVLWLLGYRCLSRNSTILYILVLTLLDFLFLLILLPSPLLFLLGNVSCSIIMPLQYVWFLVRVPLVSHSFCLYTLTCISIQRCRSIHCPLWLCCRCPQHLSWVVLALLITFITVFATMISLCFVQLSEHCWVSLISVHAFNLLLCAPILLISSTIFCIKVKPGSHQQQPKTLNIVICLIVLFTLPLSLWNLLQYFGYTVVSSQVVFLLACIHSTIKPFIYFLVERCWRPCSVGSLQLSLQRVFEETDTAHSHDPAMDTHPSMEVSTVSPSPASPTEGDDLCETDVTSVATHSVTLLICLCGLAGNGAVIGLRSLKILNSDFFMLAVIDFLFLLFAVASALIHLVEDVSCSPVLTLLYLNFPSQLSVLSYYWGLFWLMPSSNVWSMYKLCWLCCRWKLPERLLWVGIRIQYWAFFALFTVIPTVTFLWPSRQQELCRTALISMYTIILLLFVALLLISSTVDFIKAKWGSQQQQPKRCDIVIIIIAFFTFLLIL